MKTLLTLTIVFSVILWLSWEEEGVEIDFSSSLSQQQELKTLTKELEQQEEKEIKPFEEEEQTPFQGHLALETRKRTFALRWRVGLTNLQCEIIQHYIQENDFTDMSREEVEKEFEVQMLASGVLTKEQVQGYFEYLEDYDKKVREQYATEAVSELRLLFGLDEATLDKIYFLMHEDAEASLEEVLTREQFIYLQELYNLN